MKEQILALVSGMPPELGVLLMAMLPVAELRAALPVAMTTMHMQPAWAYLLCVIGNMLPVPFIILFIRPIFSWLKMRRLFRPLVERLEARSAAKAETVLRYEFWGLCLFVAIPLPGTGAWTGAMIAAMLDMRLRKAIPSILMGVLIAGLVVLLITSGVRLIF